MIITLVAVMSINNKLTRGSESTVAAWASAADGSFFKALMADHKIFIMGNTTYKAVKPKPSPEKLRIVMTRNPLLNENKQLPGQVEFSDSSPASIVSDLAQRGYKAALLLGGSEIYTLFLEAGLVDEMYLTVEPHIFGSGLNFLGELRHNLNYKLLTVRLLNDQGTVLLHYGKG